jgi:DNA-binding IclR family transcriptional regulator
MSEPTRAVDRALDILLCFSHEEPVLSLTQIAQQVGVPKSTAHRHLATLERKHFVQRDESTGLYRLGLRLVELSLLVLQEVDLLRWSQPYLERLSAECEETVDLAVLEGAHVTYLQVIESHQRVKLAAAVGQRLPACCTASGKAFLAFLPDEEVNAILGEEIIRYTEHTRCSRAELHADLQTARQRGFAISEQEYERDINAVAAPILSGDGRPVAVIAVAGPSFRLPRERMLRLGELILATTDAMAREVSLSALSVIVSKTTIPGAAGRIEQRGHYE